MDVLSQIEQWPTPAVGAAVVTAEGVVASHGDLDRAVRLGSVTSTLTALAILIAAEEGIVGLGEAAGPPGSSIRHLLGHCGGLAPQHRRLLTEPGTRRIYSHAGLELLADIVARRSDMDFASYVDEALVEPLGLERTSVQGSAAHGGEASVRDMAAVLGTLLRPAPGIIARETRVQLASPVCPGIAGMVPGFGFHDPNPWGLGVEIKGAKHHHWTGRHNSAGTFGSMGSHGAWWWLDPSAGCALVVLGDGEEGLWRGSAWPELSDEVIGRYSLASVQ